MASKRAIRNAKNRLVAKVIEGESEEGGPCAFCHRNVNDEVSYGKLYSIGDLHCHYFCVLLSCCMVQKGEDNEGLLGFLYTDILAELERSKKHRCSYCGKGGATLGCAVGQCRKQFHVPCGQEKKAVSLFYGNYKSFCEKHAPQQKVDSKIMVKAQARLALAKKKARLKTAQNNLAHSVAAQNSVAQSGAAQNNVAHSDSVKNIDAHSSETQKATQNDVVNNTKHSISAPNIITKTIAEKTAQNIVLTGALNEMAQNKLAPNDPAQVEINTSKEHSILRSILLNTSNNINNSEENNTKMNNTATDDQGADVDLLCVICYEEVTRWPGTTTFWPPCCARDAWFHRTCLQRLALSAGMHYLKCPLCNDKQVFYKAVLSQGYYVPDRDAAWELEQNAFAEIYERPLNCDAEECKCPLGPKHDAEVGVWDIQLCLLCGSCGRHRGCHPEQRFVCEGCSEAAKDDTWRRLEDALEALTEQEMAQAQATASPTGPLMPSRMSIRRTKRRVFNPKRNNERKNVHIQKEVEKNENNTESSRLELNLKSPRNIQNSPTPIQKVIQSHPIQTSIQTEVKQSPMKLLENELYEKIAGMDVVFDAKTLIDGLRLRLKKPQPLSVKKKIVNGILDEIFNNEHKAKDTAKSKEPAMASNSPSKENCTETIEQREIPRRNKQDGKVSNNKNKSLSLKRLSREKKREKVHKINENIPEIVNDLPKRVNIDEVIAENGNKSDKNASEKDTIEKQLDNIHSMGKDSELCQGEKELADKENLVKIDEVSEKNDEVSEKNDEVSINKEVDKSFATEKIMPLIDTPKKSTTVDIEKHSSFEISENDESIKIDLVKIESCTSDVIKDINLSPENKLCLKFSSDKEALDIVNVVDIESFKNQYLNEVERDKRAEEQNSKKECSFNHKNKENTEIEKQTETANDFAMEVASKKHEIRKKKKKNKKNKQRSPKIKLVYFNKNEIKERKMLKKKKKISKNESDLRVEINWREEEVKIKFKNKVLKRKRANLPENRNLKQTVLKFSPEGPEIAFACENDATPKKRKKIKHEKSQDSLKQMTIENFFKVKSP